ncbi:MAG: phage tail sheath protein [Clostridia bacterium]|nr:phage tail sheath protein [Clostridia bacterium]
MGLPQIMINFKTAGRTAVRRSARGQAVLLLEGEESGSVCFLLPEQVEQAGLDRRAETLVKLCFLGNPARVWLGTYPAGGEQAALEAWEKNAEGGWLCAPDMQAEAVSAFVRAGRAAGKPLRAVVSTMGTPDCAGVVNLTTQGIRVLLDNEAEDIATADYCARVAGLLAGLSLRQSATYHALPEVTEFLPSADPAGDIDNGRLILDRGSDGARLARAVTSLVTTADSGEAALKKIKIAEGIDLIRADIRSIFESEYVGKVLNDYDSKLLLVTAINGYFAGLTGSVLDTGRKNQAYVDYAAQKAWLESRNVDTQRMTETEILSANTGSQVFLKASVRFADAMEDLVFDITM